MKYFIEVYKVKGEDTSYYTLDLPISFLEDSLASTNDKENLETIAIFKITPKTK